MKNFVEMRVLDSDASLAVVGTSPEVGLEKGSILSAGVSVESGNQKRKSTVMAVILAGIGGGNRTMLKDYIIA
ncbi:hypothetical protein S83_003914 [Arachis hypogaea]